MSRRRVDLDELDREIREHIELETEELIARGMAPDDARAAAIRKFGNVSRVKEDVRGVWIPLWFDQLRQDARDAVRNLRRSPGFSAAIVVTLALGIGLSTAIYGVVNAVLLRPLAYAHPDRVVALATRSPRSPNEVMNAIDFAAWREQSTSLSHIVAYDTVDATVVIDGEASRIRVVAATDGIWEVTGAQPMLGALPAATDQQAIVLTHRVFREQFHGDRQVVGHVVTLDGQPATIAAVLPEDFHPQMLAFRILANLDFDRVDPGIFRMMQLAPPPAVITPTTGVRIFQAIGEVKAGITIDQARAEIEALQARQQREHPTGFGTSTVVMTPMRDKIVGPSRLALQILLSASFVVLLITCANVANLLLSRAAQRRKEIALRMSVGSGPLRVIRQLLAESMAYALLGGISGVLLAKWLITLVISLVGGGVPRLAETHLDMRVLAVAAATSMGTALVFCVGPALALVSTNVQEVLKEGGRSVSASRRVLMAGRAMVAMQVALTVILLAGAGLMVKSVWQMTRYPEGFTPDRILTMRLDLRGPQYRGQQARHQFIAALLAKAQSLPGVRNAEITTGRESTMLILKEGMPVPPPEEREAHTSPMSSISPGFGQMLGMTLASGRWFNSVEEPGVAIVNETLARREYGDADPVGQRIRFPFLGQNNYATIVGVVRDLKYADIDADPKPEIFFHHTATPLFTVMLAMGIDGDPLAAAPAIRKELSTIDPTQSFYAVRTMEQGIDQSIAPRWFNLMLLGTFALVALVLATLGVYGVVAYAVAERTQEIGIRLALGAERTRVVRMIVAQGMRSVAIGLVAGVAGAWAAARLIASLLYGVPPHDAATFALTTLALGMIAFVACATPALKAAMVDPVTALRAE